MVTRPVGHLVGNDSQRRNEKNQQRTSGSNNGVVTSQGTLEIAVPRTKPS
jgi:hypothetical protein